MLPDIEGTLDIFNSTQPGFPVDIFVEKVKFTFPILVIFAQAILLSFDWLSGSTD